MKALLPALLATWACQPTTIQLVLTPDPEINSAGDLTSWVERVEIVIDAERSLEPTEVGGSAVDWDGDGDSEVVFESRVDDWLPVLELGLGPHGGRPLVFHVRGYANDVADPVALGGTSTSCPEGELCKIGIPFNLRPSARPPRVILVSVFHDPTGALPSRVAALLSTTVAQDTVTGNVHLFDADGEELGTPVTVDTVVYSTSGPAEVRTSLQLELPGDYSPPTGPPGECTGSGIDFSVKIGPGIVGTNGLPFDQDPESDEEEPYEEDLASGGMCGTPNESGGGGGDYPPCPDGQEYNPWLEACVPEPLCDLGCPVEFVCVPDSNTCASDCRVFGTCPFPGETCDLDYGLCR